MKIISVTLCFLMSLSVLNIQASEKITVAFVEAPPFSFLDKNNSERGKLVEIFRSVVQELGLHPEFVYVPHKRQLQFIHEGKVDMWAGQKNSRIGSDIALTSRNPLFLMNFRVFWKRDEQKIESLEDLAGIKLILIASYSYGGRYNELKDRASDVIYAINHEDGLQKLYENKSYYLLGYEAIATNIIKKYGVNEFESASLARYPLYLKLSKKYPNSEQLMTKIDEYLSHLQIVEK